MLGTLTVAGALGTLGFLMKQASRLAHARRARDIDASLAAWHRFAARRGLRFVARHAASAAPRPEVRLEGEIGGVFLVFDLEEVASAGGRPVLLGPALSLAASTRLGLRTRVRGVRRTRGAALPTARATRATRATEEPRSLPGARAFEVAIPGSASEGRVPAALRRLLLAEPRISSLTLSGSDVVARAPGFVSDPARLAALLEVVLTASRSGEPARPLSADPRTPGCVPRGR